eukprot:2639261-Pleurochrysis_carterae.AAC.1
MLRGWVGYSAGESRRARGGRSSWCALCPTVRGRYTGRIAWSAGALGEAHGVTVRGRQNDVVWQECELGRQVPDGGEAAIVVAAR